jgi:subtilisin family serine protease
MMNFKSINRRNFIRAVGVSTIGTSLAQSTTATNLTEYIVSGSENTKTLIENDTEFEIKNDLIGGIYSVVGPANQESDLKQIAGVDNVVSNFVLPVPESANKTDLSPKSISIESQDSSSDTLFRDQQWDKRQINAFNAHNYATGKNTKIAIVDTGIDDQHPDLGNVNVNESLSFVNGQKGEHIGDIESHGTHTAGIAAATGEQGVEGVAPDAELVSIRIFGPRGQGGSFEDLLLAVKYSAEIGVDVVNLSLGSGLNPPQENSGGIRGTFNPVCQAAVNEGTIITTSSGNGGQRYNKGKFAIPSSISTSQSILG